MVGVIGFEPTASSSRTTRATPRLKSYFNTVGLHSVSRTQRAAPALHADVGSSSLTDNHGRPPTRLKTRCPNGRVGSSPPPNPNYLRGRRRPSAVWSDRLASRSLCRPTLDDKPGYPGATSVKWSRITSAIGVKIFPINFDADPTSREYLGSLPRPLGGFRRVDRHQETEVQAFVSTCPTGPRRLSSGSPRRWRPRLE